MTSVATVMTPASDLSEEIPPNAIRVGRETKIDDIAQTVATRNQCVLVEDDSGNIIGQLDPGKVFEVLSGVVR